jgi:hypothetical protein
LKDLLIGQIKLHVILNKYGLTMCTGFIWLRIGINGWLL